MSEKLKDILCFDNYPEAKLALGKVNFPAVIKPYECRDADYQYLAKDYGEATQMLYDAFEHTKNGWVVIESH